MRLSLPTEHRRIAVTGAAGLLGANLVLDLAAAGVSVIAIDRKGFPPAPNVSGVAGDLSDEGWLARVFADAPPDCVVHCAAATNVDWCESHPAEARHANVEVTRIVGEAARGISATMVYVSTDSVFDGERGGYREEDTPAPLNVYARTKLDGETAALATTPRCLAVRTNIFGWNFQPKFSLAEWILDRLRSGQIVPGFDDVVFSPLLVNDLGVAILEVLKAGETGVVHLGSSDRCSKLEFAGLVAAAFECPADSVRPASLASAPLSAPRPRKTWLDCGRASAALSRPLPTVAEGVARFRALEANGFAARLKSLSV